MRLAAATATLCVALLLTLAPAARADLTQTLKAGEIDIKHAGPLAFGPDGVLFIGDSRQGAIYALATGDTQGDASKVTVDVKGIDRQVAAMLGTIPDDILLNDIAVNPASGAVYLSVSRGKGANSTPVLIRVDASGKPSEVKLAGVKFAKATLNNAPAAAANQRNPAITDIAFADGKVIVAGMSNEEFASKLRVLDFPFADAGRGASVEIYHGAHGALETRSPVRTFVTLEVAGKSTVLAAYTCTPLVTFPVGDLKNGEKVTGKTVAELGSGNTPLDIISYEKDGKPYLLVSNTKYGVLKVSTEGLADAAAITTRIRGTAGLNFQPVKELANVKQLDRLNADRAVVLTTANGTSELHTIALP